MNKQLRKPVIAGNWKMNNTPAEATALIEALKPLVKDADCEVVCENGTVKLPDPYAVVRRSRPAGWDSVQPAESMPIMTDWKERFIEAYDIEFCKWVESVHAGKLTGPSSWDGYVACVAGDALNASRGTSQFMKVETMEKPEMYK